MPKHLQNQNELAVRELKKFPYLLLFTLKSIKIRNWAKYFSLDYFFRNVIKNLVAELSQKNTLVITHLMENLDSAFTVY